MDRPDGLTDREWLIMQRAAEIMFRDPSPKRLAEIAEELWPTVLTAG